MGGRRPGVGSEEGQPLLRETVRDADQLGHVIRVHTPGMAAAERGIGPLCRSRNIHQAGCRRSGPTEPKGIVQGNHLETHQTRGPGLAGRLQRGEQRLGTQPFGRQHPGPGHLDPGLIEPGRAGPLGLGLLERRPGLVGVAGERRCTGEVSHATGQQP